MHRLAPALAVLALAACGAAPPRTAPDPEPAVVTARAAPIVIAHRGASGYRPEHTLAAYELAIEQGADFIEPDLVPTADGVLIARHENELSGSTDVASRPEFAGRRATKRIDGVEVAGWFSEDFTLAELKTLRAREPLPDLRPAGAAYDGRFEVPTFDEVIALAAAHGVGIYPETKHPTYFRHEGRRLDGTPIGIDTSRTLVDRLVANGFTDPQRVFIQSFEIANLLELEQRILPAAGIDLPASSPLPERLIELQRLLSAGDDRAARVYETIGAYLGYALLEYRMLYELRHVLLLGRVMTGPGGGVVEARAGEVLAVEEDGAPVLTFHRVSERDKRHGQAVAAASLPELAR